MGLWNLYKPHFLQVKGSLQLHSLLLAAIHTPPVPFPTLPDLALSLPHPSTLPSHPSSTLSPSYRLSPLSPFFLFPFLCNIRIFTWPHTTTVFAFSSSFALFYDCVIAYFRSDNTPTLPLQLILLGDLAWSGEVTYLLDIYLHFHCISN